MAETIRDTLNKLLRGELSAVQAYGEALARHGEDPWLADLHRLRKEHEEAVQLLRQQIRDAGGEPEESSGIWGAFVQGVEGVATLFGTATTLWVLREGEERGVSDYEDTLRDPSLPEPVKALVRNRLLPRTWEHVTALERRRGGL